MIYTNSSSVSKLWGLSLNIAEDKNVDKDIWIWKQAITTRPLHEK